MDDKRRRRGKVTSFYRSMLDGLFKLISYARDGSGFVRPVGLMLSFAFTDEFQSYPISKVMAKIWSSFSKSKLPKFDRSGNRLRHGRSEVNTFKPEYLWCKETKYLDAKSSEFRESLTREEQEWHLRANQDECPIPYPHYHVAMILDDKKGCWQSIKHVLDGLVEVGIIRKGFHFSENNTTGVKTLSLKDDAGFEQFFYRAAYLAKSDTKELTDNRFWSMTQCKRRVSKPSRRKVK